MSSGVDAGAVRRPPEPADPVERLLKEYPELGALGVDWLRTWAPRAGKQIARIARVLRRYPWMAELIGQGPVGLVNPYSVEAYVVEGRVGGVHIVIRRLGLLLSRRGRHR